MPPDANQVLSHALGRKVRESLANEQAFSRWFRAGVKRRNRRGASRSEVAGFQQFMYRGPRTQEQDVPVQWPDSADQTRLRVSEKRQMEIPVFGKGKEGTVRGILYRVGRVLQVIGMLLLPIAVAGNVAPNSPLSLRASLMLSGAGVVVFVVGYWMQQAGRGG